MTRLKSIVTSSLLTAALCLAVLTTAFVLNDMQSVQADTAGNVAAITTTENSEYLPLTDAPLRRDITSQRFAPLIGTP